MNKTEAAYANHLQAAMLGGAIIWYKFEGFKVRLGNGAYYTPDFAVLRNDGTLECHEVKGFWREAAKVRIKMAAELYPFRFIVIKKGQGPEGWEREIVQ